MTPGVPSGGWPDDLLSCESDSVIEPVEIRSPRARSPTKRYTRRRLGGRQPLCACGVTSLIEPTSRPAAWSERIAVSRPDPGPLTKTSTFFMPCSCAWRAADSAASWAANGVDLREPLKPTVPDDAQLITAPVGSVIVTIVLLNVLL